MESKVLTNDEKYGLLWKFALQGINIFDMLMEDKSFAEYIRIRTSKKHTMQNGQYETFAEHFKNGTVTKYESKIDRHEILTVHEPYPVTLTDVSFKFEMKAYGYTASFIVFDHSESACVLKATEILNKLMN